MSKGKRAGSHLFLQYSYALIAGIHQLFVTFAVTHSFELSQSQQQPQQSG